MSTTARVPIRSGDGDSIGRFVAVRLLGSSASRWWIVCAFGGLLVGQVVGLFVAQGATALSGYHGSLHGLATAASPPAVYVAFSLMGLWVGFGLGPVIASMRFGTRNVADDLGLLCRLVDLVGIPLGAASVVVVSAVNNALFHNNPSLNGPAHRLTSGFHGTGALVIAALTVIGAPFFEELFFRGLLGRALLSLTIPLGRTTGTKVALAAAAIVVDGICFSAIHAERLQFISLALFGIVLMCCFTVTGRIAMGICAHGTFNLIAMLQLYHVGPWH